MFRGLCLVFIFAGLLTPAFAQQDERTQTLLGGVGAGAAPGQVAPGQQPQIPTITNPNRILQMATEPGLPGRDAGLPPLTPPKPVPVERHEFQNFVEQSLGRDLPMFGFNLFQNVPSTFAPLDRVPVTSDYVVGPGDELVINGWGQVEIDYRVTVDRSGSISVPRVGNINVAGVRYQDLEAHLKRSIGRVFTNFGSSGSRVGKLKR